MRGRTKRKTTAKVHGDHPEGYESELDGGGSIGPGKEWQRAIHQGHSLPKISKGHYMEYIVLL